jgi:hypothetical protein
MQDRKDELRELDLADDDSLREEWQTLITHMDAAVQDQHTLSSRRMKEQAQGLTTSASAGERAGERVSDVSADSAESREGLAASDNLTASMEVGQRCRVAGYGAVLGIIRFIGHVEGGPTTTTKVSTLQRRASAAHTHTRTHTHTHTHTHKLTHSHTLTHSLTH